MAEGTVPDVVESGAKWGDELRAALATVDHVEIKITSGGPKDTPVILWLVADEPAKVAQGKRGRVWTAAEVGLLYAAGITVTEVQAIARFKAKLDGVLVEVRPQPVVTREGQQFKFAWGTGTEDGSVFDAPTPAPDSTAAPTPVPGGLEW